MWKLFSRYVFAIIGVTGAIVSLSDIILRVANIGVPSIIERLNSLYRTTVAVIEFGVKQVIEFLSIETFTGSLPDGYAEALILSLVVSMSYVSALNRADKKNERENFPQRALVAPLVVLIFSVSLIGLSLILTLLRNALKDKKELEVALLTFYSIGATFSAFFILAIVSVSNN